ncbi:2-methylcitrate dehydratase [Chengkuizengella axinellae]|uniref:2-methylcitrate dehydratase n=1 Tax=Chengkuizengella axinellae TaxID=3064388 RepID=A0ABT9IXF9_9BACL|nr:2-methylcitrate dehydratase [Chengkuizengella sp. 2205SS18-9]MDP5274002.1 2-methylcitrate dehydratase [Chengkuizengella sp. 2205SS18-9]
MSYIHFKPVVKKVNVKPGGVQEIVLEVTDDGLKGQLESLCGMVDQKVEVSLNSQIITYKVTIDASTNKPVTEYTVDENGEIKEVEKGEQTQLDLGIPPEKNKTKEEKKEADKDVIDEFIMSGLAPKHDEYDFESLIKRLHEGETYMKLANELELSSGKIVEIIDEYRKSVAPHATKWDEWRQSKGETDEPTAEEKEETEEQAEETDTKDDKEDGAA